MIRYKVGNILDADVEALVNTVNTVGVMGKGIALAFKKAYPENYKKYKEASKQEKIKIGSMFLTETGKLQPKFIINFPTKKHWRNPSKLEYIEDGLKDFVNVIIENEIKSAAIPPLGCGNGKLNWDQVKHLLESYLQPIAKNIEFIIYEPGYNDQKIKEKKNVKLTPGRAMLLHALKEYQVLGYEVNLLVAQKMCYFLQRLGEPLSLRYERGYYGPYAHNLTHLLKHINGYYIYFKSERNKPDTTIRLNEDRFEAVEEYISKKLTKDQKHRIKKLIDFIEGFESPYGLELLATVDFIKRNKTNIKFEELTNEVHNWTNRKRTLMKPFHLEVAFEHTEALNR